MDWISIIIIIFFFFSVEKMLNLLQKAYKLM